MNEEQNLKEHIDKKLLTRVRIFVVVLAVMTGVLVYETLISNIHLLLLILGLVLGVGVGFMAGRMFFIEWNREKSKVIARLDRFGVIILVLYIIFSIARHWIFEYWLTGAVLSAFTIAFVEGAMLGRILSMRFHIKRVLTEQGKI